MNYLEFLQHYGTGFEDGKRQAEADRASGALMTTLFSCFAKAIFFIILFSPGILSAYFILEGLQHYTRNLNGWNYGWVFVTIIYALECVVFFLKGWNIAMKVKANLVWTIPQLIGGIYSFALPVFMIHAFIYNVLKPGQGHPTSVLNLVSWVVAGLMGIYIYSRYRWQLDSAPGLMRWAYRMGKRV
jgi:hypothetical protein